MGEKRESRVRYIFYLMDKNIPTWSQKVKRLEPQLLDYLESHKDRDRIARICLIMFPAENSVVEWRWSLNQPQKRPILSLNEALKFVEQTIIDHPDVDVGVVIKLMELTGSASVRKIIELANHDHVLIELDLQKDNERELDQIQSLKSNSSITISTPSFQEGLSNRRVELPEARQENKEAMVPEANSTNSKAAPDADPKKEEPSRERQDPQPLADPVAKNLVDEGYTLIEKGTPAVIPPSPDTLIEPARAPVEELAEAAAEKSAGERPVEATAREEPQTTVEGQPAQPAAAAEKEASEPEKKDPAPAGEAQPVQAGQPPLQLVIPSRQPEPPSGPVGEEVQIKKDEVEQPLVGRDGVANIWKEIDPPADQGDRTQPTEALKIATKQDWLMVAASRRGKMHAHKGLFREDAFALGDASGWHFMVVADGGGSRSMARVGAKTAAEVAVKAMCEDSHKYEAGDFSTEEACENLLKSGLKKAYEAIQNEAVQRELKIDDFGTTFLALAHRPLPGRGIHILGVLQVGDGLMAVQFKDETNLILADPDVGESASQTSFLTGKPWKEWFIRIKVRILEKEPVCFASMCDGVGDDLIPYNTNLPKFFKIMLDKLQKKNPEQELLEWLKYDKRGSFDDRTVALLYKPSKG